MCVQCCPVRLEEGPEKDQSGTKPVATGRSRDRLMNVDHRRAEPKKRNGPDGMRSNGNRMARAIDEILEALRQLGAGGFQDVVDLAHDHPAGLTDLATIGAFVDSSWTDDASGCRRGCCARRSFGPARTFVERWMDRNRRERSPLRLGVDVKLHQLDGTIGCELSDHREPRDDDSGSDQDPIVHRPRISSGRWSNPVAKVSTMRNRSNTWKSFVDGSPFGPRSAAS